MTKAKVRHLKFDGTEWFLNVTEKRGKKQRKILLEAARSLLAYMEAAQIADDREGAALPAIQPERALTPAGSALP